MGACVRRLRREHSSEPELISPIQVQSKLSQLQLESRTVKSFKLSSVSPASLSLSVPERVYHRTASPHHSPHVVSLQEAQTRETPLAFHDEGLSLRRELGDYVEAVVIPLNEKNFTITSEAKVYEWKGYGLIISVPSNCIPLRHTSATLDVKVGLFLDLPHTEYDFLDQPVSALYSITVGEGKLCKPITLEIQHCAATESTKQGLVKFLRSADKYEPFNAIENAAFQHKSQYGKVTVPQLKTDPEEYYDLSRFMIVLRQQFLPGSIHYKAQVYISRNNNKVMHFIIIMALDVCTSVSRDHAREVHVIWLPVPPLLNFTM